MMIFRGNALTAAVLFCAWSAIAAPTHQKSKDAPVVSGKAKSGVPARQSKWLPQILQEVEAKYSQAATLTADFSQVSESAATKSKKTTSGIIMVKRPDKIRWETHKPDKSVLVSDGRTFWFYTPPFDESENGQLIERRSAEVQSKLAHALLAGKFSVARDMKIETKGATEFVLIPKRGTASTVRRAIVKVDPAQRLITQVTLEHEGGNRADINLSNIKLGEELDERLFHFIPPPNTDLLKE